MLDTLGNKHTHSEYLVFTASHGNNGCTNTHQCNVIRSLPVLFKLRSLRSHADWNCVSRGVFSCQIRSKIYVRCVPKPTSLLKFAAFLRSTLRISNLFFLRRDCSRVSSDHASVCRCGCRYGFVEEGRYMWAPQITSLNVVKIILERSSRAEILVTYLRWHEEGEVESKYLCLCSEGVRGSGGRAKYYIEASFDFASCCYSRGDEPHYPLKGRLGEFI
jgi:hypothetical protein